MVRCHICDKSCSGTIKVTEPRYFHLEQTICSSCFDEWAVQDYKTLDKKAIDKLEVKHG